MADEVNPMELLNHQPIVREDDGETICSRCGLINPGDDDGCIPINLKQKFSDSDRGDKAA